MGPLGWQEMAFIFLLALLLFGPKKLPELGKGLGESIRGFKAAMAEKPTDGSNTKPEDGKTQS